MEIFKIEHFCFTYPGRTIPALSDISMTVNGGEFITIFGKSGCGKSTLLHNLKPVLSPAGTKGGKIYFRSQEILNTNSSEIGFVMQNPDNQIVTDKVWHELAFGLESMGLPNNEIRARVAETASFFGIQNLFHENVYELSGGQKQILNLASVMAMQPSVIILDEPSAGLDPIAAEEFFSALEKINKELGTTVILSEHNLDHVFPLSDRAVYMANGKIIADAPPCEIADMTDADISFSLPAPMRIYLGLSDTSAKSAPVTVRDGKNWLYSLRYKTNPLFSPRQYEYDDEIAVDIKNVRYRYEKNLPDVINGLSFAVHKGEICSFLGGNGAGKSTLAALTAGLIKPQRGNIKLFGTDINKIPVSERCGMMGVLPQDPRGLFIKDTIRDDFFDMSDNDTEINKIAELFGLTHLTDCHPYDLSVGELHRAALAKVFLSKPPVLILDEPTNGTDGYCKKILANILIDLKKRGTTVIIISHDTEFCASVSDTCAMLFGGEIVSSGNPSEFFSCKNFYTTPANRMARDFVPSAVTSDEVISAFGGKIPHTDSVCYPASDSGEKKTDKKTNKKIKENPENTKKEPPKNILSKHTAVSLLITMFIVPLTIFGGIYMLDDRKYYFISLMIIFEIMLPFFINLEREKAKAEKLVVIASFAAVAAVGRIAFYMIPQFKPMSAVIIIAGICFGAESGFLAGALSAFASNMFFGQGPWTPWQMFCLGMIGFISGLLSRKIKYNKLFLCIYGFFAVMIIYGGIINFSALIYEPEINISAIAAVYANAFVFDLINAFSTAFFLWIISEPLIRKTERIKYKYGLY